MVELMIITTSLSGTDVLGYMRTCMCMYIQFLLIMKKFSGLLKSLVSGNVCGYDSNTLHRSKHQLLISTVWYIHILQKLLSVEESVSDHSCDNMTQGRLTHTVPFTYLTFVTLSRL